MPNHSMITIAGHLGRDASTKQVGDSTVTEFSLAVNHKAKGEDITMWFRCALWGSRGEKLAEYLTKGKAVLVSGRFHTREYEGKNGPTYSLEVNVSELALLGGGEGKQSDSPPPAGDESFPENGDMF